MVMNKIFVQQPCITIISSIVVYAAVNAIINKTRESIEGCTIYLTLFPNEKSAHAIIKAGIKRIVYCMYTRKERREREADMKKAEDILDRNGIIHVHV